MSLTSSLGAFLGELRRRRVVRVVIVYWVVSWALIEIAGEVEEPLSLPPWTDTLVILLAALVFPLAVILAWAYDIGPDGVRRTEPGAPDGAVAPEPGLPAVGARVATRQVPVRRPSAKRDAVRPAQPPEGSREVPTPSEGDLRRALLATFRHELRTPLNAIIGYSELLLEDLPPERSASLRSILTAGQRSLLLVNEILRPDAAEDELTDESLAFMRQRIRQEMREPMRRLSELCDQARAELADLDPATREDVERLGKAAARLEELVRSEVSGPGFGMDQAEGLTRELAARVIAGLPRSGTSADDAPPRHGQILVVDDNETNRDLLSRQLARQGFSVSLAEDGAAALDLLQRQNFDLVLLDVLMPGLDGIGVLMRMQGSPATSEIPVIMTSAMDELDGVVRCIEQGAVDYLIKPFEPVLLQARVAATLDLHRLRAQQRRARQELEAEVDWSERLARSLVPDSLASRIRDGRGTLVENHDGLMVLVAELHGISTFAARQGEGALGVWLAETMRRFEECGRDLPVQLHWESGAVLVGSGGDGLGREPAAAAIAELALRLRDEGAARAGEAEAVRVGIGIHVGPAVSALVEAERLAFGLWGEAPDLARELASRGDTGEIRVSPAAYAALRTDFDFEVQGIVETSSGAQMRVYRLVDRRADVENVKT